MTTAINALNLANRQALAAMTGAATACETYGADPSASAAVNSAAIQSVLNLGGFITLMKPGIYQINAILQLAVSNTHLYIGEGVTLQVVAPSPQWTAVTGTKAVVSGTVFTVAGADQTPTGTNILIIGRRIQLVTSVGGTVVGHVQVATYASGGGGVNTVTVVLDSGTLSGTMSAASVGNTRLDYLFFITNYPTPVTHVSISGKGTLDGQYFCERLIYSYGNNNDIELSGLELMRGVAGASPGDAVHLVGLDQSTGAQTNISVIDLNVHDCGEGILLEYVNGGFCSGCQVFDMAAQDEYEASRSDNILFVNNMGRNPGPDNSFVDIYDNCSNIMVLGFNGIKTDNNPGVYALTSQGTAGRNNKNITYADVNVVAPIPGSQNSGANPTGFKIGFQIKYTDDIALHHVKIVGSVYDTASNGIQAQSGSVGRVDLDHVTIDTSGSSAMQFVTVGDLSITDCHFKDSHFSLDTGSEQSVLDISGTMSSLTLRGNTWQNTLATKRAFYYFGGWGAVSPAGNATNSSAVVTGISGPTTASLRVGMVVTGNGIIPGTAIKSIDSSSQITLNFPFYGSTGAVSLSYYPPVTISGNMSDGGLAAGGSGAAVNYLPGMKFGGGNRFGEQNNGLQKNVDYFCQSVTVSQGSTTKTFSTPTFGPVDINSVTLTPQSSPSAAGITEYWVTLSSPNLVINTNGTTMTSFTGTTNSTTLVSGITSTVGMVVGAAVAGNGIAGGTTIAAILSATSIQLSAATTQTNVGQTIYYGANFLVNVCVLPAP